MKELKGRRTAMRPKRDPSLYVDEMDGLELTEEQFYFPDESGCAHPGECAAGPEEAPAWPGECAAGPGF